MPPPESPPAAPALPVAEVRELRFVHEGVEVLAHPRTDGWWDLSVPSEHPRFISTGEPRALTAPVAASDDAALAEAVAHLVLLVKAAQAARNDLDRFVDDGYACWAFSRMPLEELRKEASKLLVAVEQLAPEDPERVEAVRRAWFAQAELERRSDAAPMSDAVPLDHHHI